MQDACRRTCSHRPFPPVCCRSHSPFAAPHGSSLTRCPYAHQLPHLLPCPAAHQLRLLLLNSGDHGHGQHDALLHIRAPVSVSPKPPTDEHLPPKQIRVLVSWWSRWAVACGSGGRCDESHSVCTCCGCALRHRGHRRCSSLRSCSRWSRARWVSSRRGGLCYKSTALSRWVLLQPPLPCLSPFFCSRFSAFYPSPLSLPLCLLSLPSLVFLLYPASPSMLRHAIAQVD